MLWSSMGLVLWRCLMRQALPKLQGVGQVQALWLLLLTEIAFAVGRR